MELGTIAQWSSVGITFFAVLVALFKDDILSIFKKPKLIVSISQTPPDCQKTKLNIPTVTGSYIPSGIGPQGPVNSTIQNVADCYYIRIWIENNGKSTAKRIQVSASKLLKQQADLSFREVEGFIPMDLKWSHSQPGNPEIYAEGISPKMGKHCDLGHIIDPKHRSKFPGEDLPEVSRDKTILSLDIEVQAYTLSHLVPPGVYQLELKVAGDNCAPVTKVLEITIKGEWFEDQKKMFSEAIGIKLVV